MASATFTVEHPRNRRFVIQQDIAEIAGRVASTPPRTRRTAPAMARGWHTVPGQDPGTTLVVNTVPHARYVEYGTRHMPARAPLGRAAAAGRR